ncbi:unnamed protein product [Phytophthora lilii]|uniref:Unnamed protein product n=1 Tax=Phytophthora lilii TaxID=2077276 RepID=A0A9W6XLY9_9STRA|nr:unnamed protein product [Phytophthora lilii]
MELVMKYEVLMQPRTATYEFHLDPISVERIDILEAKVVDLQGDIKRMRVEETRIHGTCLSVEVFKRERIDIVQAEVAATKSTLTVEILDTISALRDEVKILHEKKDGVFRAQDAINAETQDSQKAAVRELQNVISQQETLITELRNEVITSTAAFAAQDVLLTDARRVGDLAKV